MSRLHECITKGVDKVPSDKHWAGTYPTVADRMQDLYLKAVVSPRADTRNKTKRKTAQALGHDFHDTRPWKVRNSGIISSKSAKVKKQTQIKKVIAEKAKGDVKL